MQKKALLTLILLVVTAWAVAQQGSNSQLPSSGASQAPSQQASQQPESAVEGCLSGSAGSYTVTDKAGTSYKLQLPDSSHNAVLDKHAGQQVRVHGIVGSADTSAAPGAGESKEASAAGSMKSPSVIKASSLEKIADTCSAAATPPDKK